MMLSAGCSARKVSGDVPSESEGIRIRGEQGNSVISRGD